MKAMIWKEWRENAKWGALAFVSLLLAVVYLTAQGLVSPYGQNAANPLVLTSTLWLFLAPLFAGALGILQVAGELRRDQWAFLLHRPVSRTVIFGGKVVAGLSLYAVTTIAPLLLLALWMKSPGAIPAPFDWRLLLGSLASILAGVSFYFAGMLTAIRPARWYGSRALGFAGAVIGLLLVNSVPEFWQAVLIVLAIASILGLAAWGSFLTTGTYERQPRIAKVALGLTLYCGIVGVMVASTLFAVTTPANRERMRRFDGQNSRSEELYGISRTGQVLLIKYDESGAASSAKDLQGHPVRMSRQELAGSLAPSYLYDRENFFTRLDFRSPSRYFINLFPGGRNDRTLFYWSVAQRRILVYSREGNREIGSIGPNGFTPRSSGEAVPFDEDLVGVQNGSNGYLAGNGRSLPFLHSLYVLQKAQRRATPVFTTNDPLGIHGLSYLSPDGSMDTESDNDLVVVLVGKNAHVLTPQGRPLFVAPIERDISKGTGITFSKTNDNQRLFFRYEPYAGFFPVDSPQAIASISEFSSKGKLLARYPLPLLSKSKPVATNQPYWYELAGHAVSIPPVAMVTAFTVVNYFAQRQPIGGDQSYLRSFKTASVCSILLGLVCAPFTFWVARRAALSNRATWGWIIATFPLGLSGTLLLLSLREWSARVNCPTCSQKRSVNHDLCEHCGAPFPPPAQDETSIIEERIDEDDLARILERV